MVGKAKVPKSPRMSQTKKNPQVAISVQKSPRNLRFKKLLMEEKGKTVTIESDEEEEDPSTFVEEIELEHEMDEDI